MNEEIIVLIVLGSIFLFNALILGVSYAIPQTRKYIKEILSNTPTAYKILWHTWMLVLGFIYWPIVGILNLKEKNNK